MPRREEPEDDEIEDDELFTGDDDDVEEWTDFIEAQTDRNEDWGAFLDMLDYLDDIFDYPEDDDWYEET